MAKEEHQSDGLGSGQPRARAHSAGANAAARIRALGSGAAGVDCSSIQASERELEIHRIKKTLLNKKSFCCLVLGRRQTGKRTLVKCFVKLLNEFKLAAQEYKREKTLNKLLNCHEQIQGLMLDSEPQAADNNPLVGNPITRRRINSWLVGSQPVGGGGGGTKSKLLTLPQLGKRRINSVVAALGPAAAGATAQRRHTTHDPSVEPPSRPGADLGQSIGCLADALEDAPAQRSPAEEPPATDKSQTIELDQANPVDQIRLPVPMGPIQQAAPISASESPRSSGGSTRGCPRWSLDSGDQSAAQQAQAVEPAIVRQLRPMLSLKEMNKRRVKVRFSTRRQLSDRLVGRQEAADERGVEPCIGIRAPDSFLVIYSISDRESFDYARELIVKIRQVFSQSPCSPIILVANKVDLERARAVKIEDGKYLARKYGCKFMEISCAVGFNLDTLLVGLRTQLILRHHVTLNSIIRRGKLPRAYDTPASSSSADKTLLGSYKGALRARSGDNFLIRLYRKYLLDPQEIENDCDNFSKL